MIGESQTKRRSQTSDSGSVPDCDRTRSGVAAPVDGLSKIAHEAQGRHHHPPMLISGENFIYSGGKRKKIGAGGWDAGVAVDGDVPFNGKGGERRVRWRFRPAGVGREKGGSKGAAPNLKPESGVRTRLQKRGWLSSGETVTPEGLEQGEGPSSPRSSVRVICSKLNGRRLGGIRDGGVARFGDAGKKRGQSRELVGCGTSVRHKGKWGLTGAPIPSAVSSKHVGEPPGTEPSQDLP